MREARITPTPIFGKTLPISRPSSAGKNPLEVSESCLKVFSDSSQTWQPYPRPIRLVNPCCKKNFPKELEGEMKARSPDFLVPLENEGETN
jgi:hypothetical protein